MRRDGYLFIPVYDDELSYHLNASAVKNNKVIETAELAIRENILHARMFSLASTTKRSTLAKCFITDIHTSA